MKRMICFVSGQLLPNFIPVNEPQTRPGALHAVFTPGNLEMTKNWRLLKTTLTKRFPNLQFEEIEIENEYDGLKIKGKCESLLRDNPSDDWSLNATGGTKLMSSPAIEVFNQAHRPVYYVETPKNRTLLVKSDWTAQAIPFEAEIDLQTYFELFGKLAKEGELQSGQEKAVFESLKKLDWRVWQSVEIFDQDDTSRSNQLAEFDSIGICFYQLYAFECKRLDVTEKSVKSGQVKRRELERAKDSILIDLYKLAQVREAFGGPFGKTFWVFSGRTPLSDVNKKRIKDFRIKLIQGSDISQIAKDPKKFGLPACKKAV
jgi:hypothetical protein